MSKKINEEVTNNEVINEEILDGEIVGEEATVEEQEPTLWDKIKKPVKIGAAAILTFAVISMFKNKKTKKNESEDVAQIDVTDDESLEN